jgi:hypothetical protein
MGTPEFTDRKSFLKALASWSSQTKDALEEVRKELAALPPAVLLRFWFGPLDADASGSPSVQALRKAIRKRSVLFEWVYAAESPVARELLYARLPSSEKRRLVSLLLRIVRTDLPWLDSRTLHAMAFRPSFFEERRDPTPDKSQADFGPLYRRMGIPKGRGKRILTIPNPALMQIHRTLLQIVGPPLERALEAGVFGATRGVRGPTFQNAAEHRRGAFIASFDLKDFFPSVRVGDIIYGFQQAAKRGIPMVDSEKLPEVLSESPQRRQLKWTPDAMRLIARLCTHRSRLPQGAPLSPLLASVAFSRMDRRIIRRLRRTFGTGGFKYTRYFDDITISLTADTARGLKDKDRAAVLKLIEDCVSASLTGSNFALNPRKSRGAWIRGAASAGGEGASQPFAEVTGLLVRPSGISMPRQVKRAIREAAHRIEHRCFAEIAREWHGRGERELPEWTGSSTRGHRWKRTAKTDRRSTAERLAVLMLLRTNRDLRVRLLHEDWYAWQSGIAKGVQVRKGAGARDVLQRLLTAHWRGQTSVRQSELTELTFSHDGTDVCAVSSESSLDYLYLAPEDAFVVADYWHHLRGMLAYLNGCPREGDEFEAVRQLRDTLASAVQQIHFEKRALRAGKQSSSGEDFIWSVDEALAVALREAERAYFEFARSIGFDASAVWGAHRSGLVQRAANEQGFHDWLCVLSRLTVRTLSKLPRECDGDSQFKADEFFEYLRLREDISLRRIHPDYRLVIEFERHLGLHDKSVPESTRCAQAQEKMLWKLASLMAPPSASGQVETPAAFNPRHLSQEEQLVRVVDRLSKALAAARSGVAEQRLLSPESGIAFDRERLLLVDSATTRASDANWDHLFKVSSVLQVASLESLEPGLWWREVGPQKNGNHPDQVRRNHLWNVLAKLHDPAVGSRLKLVRGLRNRAAHAPSPERRKEWVELQEDVSKSLGRCWEGKPSEPKSSFYSAEDLRLTAHETLWLKISLMEALAVTFELASERRVWEDWSKQRDTDSA